MRKDSAVLEGHGRGGGTELSGRASAAAPTARAMLGGQRLAPALSLVAAMSTGRLAPLVI